MIVREREIGDLVRAELELWLQRIEHEGQGRSSGRGRGVGIANGRAIGVSIRLPGGGQSDVELHWRLWFGGRVQGGERRKRRKVASNWSVMMSSIACRWVCLPATFATMSKPPMASPTKFTQMNLVAMTTGTATLQLWEFGCGALQGRRHRDLPMTSVSSEPLRPGRTNSQWTCSAMEFLHLTGGLS